MSKFGYNIDTETGTISFSGELDLKDVGDWGSESSEYFNAFMKAEGKNKLSNQIGALCLIFRNIEDQEGTEVILH